MKQCEICKKEIIKKRNESRKYFKTKKFCSYVCMAEDYKNRVGNNKGKHWKNVNDFERKSKASMGSKNPAWKGGVTPEHQRIRNSKEHSDWSLAVLRRDKFRCRKCKKVGGKLIAHHIKSFADYPELRFKLSNGITLCRVCHGITHKIGI